MTPRPYPRATLGVSTLERRLLFAAMFTLLCGVVARFFLPSLDSFAIVAVFVLLAAVQVSRLLRMWRHGPAQPWDVTLSVGTLAMIASGGYAVFSGALWPLLIAIPIAVVGSVWLLIDTRKDMTRIEAFIAELERERQRQAGD